LIIFYRLIFLKRREDRQNIWNRVIFSRWLCSFLGVVIWRRDAGLWAGLDQGPSRDLNKSLGLFGIVGAALGPLPFAASADWTGSYAAVLTGTPAPLVAK